MTARRSIRFERVLLLLTFIILPETCSNFVSGAENADGGYYYPHDNSYDRLANMITLQNAAEQWSNLALSAALNPNSLPPGRCRNDTKFWLRSLADFMNAARIQCDSTDTQCSKFKYDMITNGMFAAKQLDAFGKTPSGLLDVNVIWMGSWQECINIKAPTLPDYDAQFCYIALSSSFIANALNSTGLNAEEAPIDACNAPLLIQWSVCVPKTCSDKEVSILFAPLQNFTGDRLISCGAKCISADGPKKDAAFYVVCVYCTLGAVLLVVAGFIDYYTDRECFKDLRKRTCMRCLLAFSLYTNGGEILDQTKRDGQINCLDCIRTLSMTWVICGHVMANFISADNPLRTVDSARYFLNDSFLNAYFAVDSFFFIGGVLLAYVFFRQMDKTPQKMRSPIYWILYYLHRFLRLSPPYFLFIGVTAAIQDHITIGPMNLNMLFISSGCRKTWWRNLLYINNLYDLQNECMGHTWYLAVDWQIHLFSPLIIVPLFFSLKAAIIIAFILIALSTVANYVTFYLYDFPANYIGLFSDALDADAVAKYEQLIYFAPWIRFTPYIFGVFTGYFLHKTRDKKLNIHPLISMALWLASLATAIACVFGLYDYMKGPTHNISLAARSSYYNWSRIAWAIMLSWIVIACQKNWAGPIKNFMELGFWMPFGRLTYCAYLTHYVIADAVLSMKRQPLHFVSDFETYVNYTIPAFACSYAFAFVWSCMFELSFMKLEKMFISKLTDRSSSHHND